MRRPLTALSLAALLAIVALTRDVRADGNVQNVNHIIIVMQENHSFDNYFGALAYGRIADYSGT